MDVFGWASGPVQLVTEDQRRSLFFLGKQPVSVQNESRNLISRSRLSPRWSFPNTFKTFSERPHFAAFGKLIHLHQPSPLAHSVPRPRSECSVPPRSPGKPRLPPCQPLRLSNRRGTARNIPIPFEEVRQKVTLESSVARCFVEHAVTRKRKYAAFAVLVAVSAGKNKTPFTPNSVNMNGVF